LVAGKAASISIARSISCSFNFALGSYVVVASQGRIENDLPLSIIMSEPLANYVKSQDWRCELATEARMKTVNEPLLLHLRKI